jgi:uncharacterized protein YprB with RNaseH-like and TPR domain
MLENTFCHLPGIGSGGEALLWREGIRTWGDFLSRDDASLPHPRFSRVRAELHRCRERLDRGDILFFSRQLPAREQWRLFAAFRHAVAYLDIETTGLGRPHDHITTIALYDGSTIRHYVHGRNLGQVIEDLHNCHLLVTYNGKSFDIPFMEREFGISIPQAHLDLMYVLRSLGITGGLKGCERQLGIMRDDLDGVDGYLAVILWRHFRAHDDRKALETLLAYNMADAVNLEMLAVKAYNRKLQGTPFAGSHELPLPASPTSPFRADVPTVQRLIDRYRGA